MLPAWFVLIGAVLVAMAFASHLVERLPLSAAILYLAAGCAIGPLGLSLLPVDPVSGASVIELLTELAVLITLFGVGLRLRVPLGLAAWGVPLRLATVAMFATIALTSGAAYALLGLSPFAALLLASILAPTDPVLASEVQVHKPGDRDALRFSLSAEGGLNDGAAFPAVVLALGLLGQHELGPWGVRWLLLDVLWPIAGGVVLGWSCGHAVWLIVRRLRRVGHALEFEEFLVLGVIALTYGAALVLHTYGFLAVFAAGLALAHRDRREMNAPAGAKAKDSASPDGTLSGRLLTFGSQCERLAEVALVLLIGAAIAWIDWSWSLAGFVAVALLVVRPLAVLAVIPARSLPPTQRRLIAWFGIRGVGSVYYLMYAIHHGIEQGLARDLASATLATIVVSIVIHGVSATPLMSWYHRRRKR